MKTQVNQIDSGIKRAGMTDMTGSRLHMLRDKESYGFFHAD